MPIKRRMAKIKRELDAETVYILSGGWDYFRTFADRPGELAALAHLFGKRIARAKKLAGGKLSLAACEAIAQELKR